MRRIQPLPITVIAASIALLGACGGGGESTDTAAAIVDTAGRTPATAQAPAAAQDANHEFLRMMSDHHEGLIAMASPAMTKASRQTTQGDAHKLHTKQEEEQKRMVAMIQSSYGESYTPKIIPQHQAMNDSLQAKSGAAYDSTFYADVVKHHQEGIQMIDRFLPQLTNAEVRQMVEKMRTEQTREIEEFQRKMRS